MKLWLLGVLLFSITQYFVYDLFLKPRFSEGYDLVKIYQDSLDIKNSRYNETQKYLNQAKLKGTSNSYLEPAYLNDKEGILIERDSEGHIKRENATILVLCRNSELDEILSSMRSLEDRFNKNYHYTWTFLNDVEFTEDFKLWTTEMASGDTEYGLIPSDDWNVPAFINQTKYDECIEESIRNNVIYGFSKSYRNMCRFNSGFFFRQELVNKYDYYFRVEPGVQYYCDFQYDPFKFLRENNKKYSFVVSLYEYIETIPTLWDTVEKFMFEKPELIHINNSYEFITDKTPITTGSLELGDQAYNLCHFWSNFEIGDLNFFRSKEYLEFFEFLDKTGGFYYERWGDAPVHSIAASLLLDTKEIHYFDDIGYTHAPFHTFPEARQVLKYKRCVVPKDEVNFNVVPSSCLARWWKLGGGKTFLKENFNEREFMLFKEHYLDDKKQ